MRMNFGRVAFTALMIGTMTGSLAAQSVELVSRSQPSQASDTGAGAAALDHPEAFSNAPALSADGRYVVFLSSANNLVAGQKDPNQREGDFAADVFVKDLVTGTTTLVSRSLSSPVTTGNRPSREAVISADGRYIAFTSFATDLVPGQTGSDPGPGLFLYDRVQGTTSLVTSPSFLQGNLAISADGRYVAFSARASLVPGQQGPGQINVFLYDRVGKTFRLASHTSDSTMTEQNAQSNCRGMSADGRYVLFSSTGPPPLQQQSVSFYDRTTEAVTLVGPGKWASISANGKSIAAADDLHAYLYDRETLETVRLSSSVTFLFGIDTPVLSSDGRFVAFLSNDPDRVPGQQGLGAYALFLYDRMTRTYTLASRRHGSPTLPGSQTRSHAISADGRFVVYASSETDMVTGQVDENGYLDVFLFDRLSGATTLLSHKSTSPLRTGNSISQLPAISANGSRVAFVSPASDLVAGIKDFNNGTDVFAYDTASGNKTVVTARVPEMPSLSPSAPSSASTLSADGRFAVFASGSIRLIAGQTDGNGTADLFLYDRTTRNTVLVSRSMASATTTARGHSAYPVISADGRYVAFLSNAPDLAPGVNGPVPTYHVFLFDRVSGTTTRVGNTGISEASDLFEGYHPQISPDGRWVAFCSLATDLIPGQQDQGQISDVFLWDRLDGSTVLVSRSTAGATVAGDGFSSSPVVSSDGRYVAFLSGAGNLVQGQISELYNSGVFLFDRVAGRTALVSHTRDSAVTLPNDNVFYLDMSSDGRFIVFSSSYGNLDPNVDSQDDSFYVWDRVPGTFQWIGPEFVLRRPRISADGRYIVFFGLAEVPGETPLYQQLYLYDRMAKSSVLVTRSSVHPGQPTAGMPQDPVLSADGRYVAFASDAGGLVPGQTPSLWIGGDIYLFDRITGTTTLASRSRTSATTGVGRSERPLISASGRQVAFTSAGDLSEGDLNNRPDAYVFSLDPPPPVLLPSCTLLDTRRRADRPVLTSNVQRTVTVRGACGVLATAKQVVVKMTVFNPSGKGNLRFYPGAFTATPSGILRFERGATRTETFTLPLSANGTLTILPLVAGKGTVHVAVEVNGYSQ
jgi:Tol biopolymer transport system component